MPDLRTAGKDLLADALRDARDYTIHLLDDWAAWPAEYTRNVAHLYPGYERAALQPRRSP